MVEEHLIREFIAEAEEHLFTLEPNLLRLEKYPDNKEIVNEIFLATHSIKGTAAYVGLSHISNFTHSLENLLDRLRKGSLSPSAALIDTLLQGVDTLKRLVRHVALGQPAPDTTESTRQLLQWEERNSEHTQAERSSDSFSPQPESCKDIDGNSKDFASQLAKLQPEDAEIFADIAGQQLELMRLSLENIREHGLSVDKKASSEALATLIKAFRNIKSSAVLLDVEELDTTLDRQNHLLSHFEAPSHILTEENLETIAGIIQDVGNIAKRISTYSVEEAEPPSQAQSADLSRPFVPDVYPQGKTLRVNAERVDHLLNLVGELVINRARLEQAGKKVKHIYEALRAGDMSLNHASSIEQKSNIRGFKKLKEQFDEITLEFARIGNQMQEGTMRIRMVPMSQVLNRFPRMVRDLSRQAGKEVDISIQGAETELDKSVIDLIGEPLIHIIRNAIDHGIERPEEREQGGKTHQGQIGISAYHEGNQVIIDITDDGRGIDAQLIKEKALKQQIISPQEANTLQYKELSYLIFHNGFSTVEAVSSLSGRGVGLNVVKHYLEKINGAVELQSLPGKGCRFSIRLPLTLAIIPALMVKVKTEIFAIPLISVEEAIRIVPDDIKTIESHKVIHLRERMVPIFDLAELFGSALFEARKLIHSANPEFTEEPEQDENDGEERFYGVIISDGFREIGLIVDRFLGENDLVIKSLDDELLKVEGISGASIRGDGEISLVIDPVSLTSLAIKHLQRSHRARSDAKQHPQFGHDDTNASFFPTQYFPESESESEEASSNPS
ncbi:MAG: chemotaxis protein CheA [bacterium]|nr:chemotaxis protein CheA [bacterium]